MADRRFRPVDMAKVLGTCLVVLSVGSPACADPPQEGFVDTFEKPGVWDWRLSDYAHPGGWIDTRWDPRQISEEVPGRLDLVLEPDEDAGKHFVSAELRRRTRSGFGRYEVVMQPARGSGLNSAFFTYTGPHRGDPKDEVDIEFLGRDTTGVWVNAFSDGVAMPGRLIPLGFDAADRPRLYAFEWSPQEIRWYVGDRLIHRHAPTGKAQVPQTPGQVYVSLWAGSRKSSAWLGPTQPDTSAVAQYHCISYRPMGEVGRQCSDIWAPR